MTKQGMKSCELCSGAAAVYCEADSAFLCWSCDARVHGANFLVARHHRRVACAQCQSLDSGRLLVGPGSPQPLRSLCHYCDGVDSELSSASSCVSTADSSDGQESDDKNGARAILDRRVDGILVNWGRRLGVDGRCVEVARQALGACGGRTMTGLPSRIRLAAALWFAVKQCDGTCNDSKLKGLEKCSGVPAKVIAIAESRLARAARRVVMCSNFKVYV